MNIEKDEMRQVISREISQCDILKNETMPATRHFCDNYEKNNVLIIDEVRNTQRKKSLKILDIKDNSTIEG